MSRKIERLTLSNKNLKKQVRLKPDKVPFSFHQIKTDAKMNFYTGIVSIQAFHKIFEIL